MNHCSVNIILFLFSKEVRMFYLSFAFNNLDLDVPQKHTLWMESIVLLYTGQDKAVSKSKYEEDVYINNHTVC